MRVIVALPRSLDDDLLRATGLTLTEYLVLMNLSEAENQELRMADLAAAAALSASRITRVVEALQGRDQVVKRRYEGRRPRQRRQADPGRPEAPSGRLPRASGERPQAGHGPARR